MSGAETGGFVRITTGYVMGAVGGKAAFGAFSVFCGRAVSWAETGGFVRIMTGYAMGGGGRQGYVRRFLR